MPRHDNELQHRFGAYDYRTQAEDNRLHEADARKRNEELHRQLEEQARRQREEESRRKAEQQRAADAAQRQREEQRRRTSAPKPTPSTQKRPDSQPSPKSWSWIACFIGLFVGLGFASSQLGLAPGGCWIVAGVAAVVFGLYYKQIIVLAVLGGIAAAVFSPSETNSPGKATSYHQGFDAEADRLAPQVVRSSVVVRLPNAFEQRRRGEEGPTTTVPGPAPLFGLRGAGLAAV